MQFPFTYWSNAARGGYGATPSGSPSVSGSNYCNRTGANELGTYGNPYLISNFLNEGGSTYVTGTYLANSTYFSDLITIGPTSGDSVEMWTPQIFGIINIVAGNCLYFVEGVNLYFMNLITCEGGMCQYNIISQGPIYGIWADGLEFTALSVDSQASGTITMRIGVTWPYWMAFTLNLRLVDGATIITQNQGPFILPAYYQYNPIVGELFAFNAVVTAGTYLLEYQMVLPNGQLGGWTPTGLTAGLSVY